jgi:hypothetical protein
MIGPPSRVTSRVADVLHVVLLTGGVMRLGVAPADR